MKFPTVFRTFAALSTIFLTGCAVSTPQSFSWYHPQGGEYLFAYDRGQCETHVAEKGLRLTADISGPFFSCMHDRGYYLVDGDQIIQAPATPPVANGPVVTGY